MLIILLVRFFSQLPHDLYELLHVDSAVDAKVAVFEHHEVAIIVPGAASIGLLLPVPPQLYLARAVAIIQIVALVLDQHDLAGLRHHNEIWIMFEIAVEAEIVSLNDPMPPFHVAQSDDGVQQIPLLVVHIVFLRLV